MSVSAKDTESRARNHEIVHVERHPGDALSSCVSRLWTVLAPSYPYQRETIFPDGAIEIMLTIGPVHGVVDRGSGKVARYDRAWVSGLRSRPITVEAKAGYELVGIRLLPHTAATFLDVPACELTDQVVDLGALWGDRVVEELRELLSESRTVDRRFGVLSDVLARRASGGPPPPPFVSAAVAAVTQDKRDMAISALANRMGVSHRRLIDGFERYVGLKPKALQRVLRFQRVIRMEDECPTLPWSTIARTCGYYDQAHMINEFRELAELTPARYRGLRAEYPNYVPEPAPETTGRSTAEVQVVER